MTTPEIELSLVIPVYNEEENLTGKDVWYTLSGCRQKVKPATKGIYIHQGRKEIVK
jgi:hypothetical protein